jgi:hypothetical protein
VAVGGRTVAHPTLGCAPRVQVRHARPAVDGNAVRVGWRERGAGGRGGGGGVRGGAAAAVLGVTGHLAARLIAPLVEMRLPRPLVDGVAHERAVVGGRGGGGGGSGDRAVA